MPQGLHVKARWYDGRSGRGSCRFCCRSAGLWRRVAEDEEEEYRVAAAAAAPDGCGGCSCSIGEEEDVEETRGLGIECAARRGMVGRARRWGSGIGGGGIMATRAKGTRRLDSNGRREAIFCPWFGGDGFECP